MKKIPLFITACLLVSFFSGCDEWRSSSKPEPQPKSKPEPQPEKPKSNTYTRSPSVACSADGKTVYWLSNDEKYNEIDMYKSEDGGNTWVKINPHPKGVSLYDDPYDESTYISVPVEDPVKNARDGYYKNEEKRKAVPIPRNGK